MKSFTVESEKKAIVRIDTNTCSKEVIAKVVYWFNRDFTIMQSLDGKDWTLTLETQNIVVWDEVKKRLSQLFADYQMREVIAAETKDIKNILYIKAFANVDELFADEKV